jgi:hypothetical protein
MASFRRAVGIGSLLGVTRPACGALRRMSGVGVPPRFQGRRETVKVW